MLKRNFSFSLEVRPWIALGGMENLFSPYPEFVFSISNSDQTTDSAAKFVPRCKLCLKLDLQGAS